MTFCELAKKKVKNATDTSAFPGDKAQVTLAERVSA